MLSCAVLACGLLLTACSEWPIDSTNKDYLQQQALQQKVLQQRVDQLSQVQTWQLTGRFSLVTETEAWSGQLYWRQSVNNFLIQFNAPSGQGALQLAGDNDMVELRLANGESYQAKDAETLLRQQTSWDLPVTAMWFWIRALPDPQQPHHLQLTEQEQIKQLEQNDWHVEYDGYQQYGSLYFPRKVTIKNQDTRLRVIVTNWVFI